MKSLTHEDLENQVKEKLKHVSASAPQEQAEAMAREMLHSRIHSKTKFEDTLATALSKLIAENERLKESQRVAGILMRQVVNDLPSRRDWLDPQLEANLKAFLSTLTAEKKEEAK